jgi:hypothetical protein
MIHPTLAPGRTSEGLAVPFDGIQVVNPRYRASIPSNSTIISALRCTDADNRRLGIASNGRATLAEWGLRWILG